MRPLSRVLLLGICLLLARNGLSREEAEGTLSGLRQKIAAHVGQEKFRAAAWGIKIVALNSGAVLFETNAYKLLKPASNAKLFTGALALDALGPDRRIRTSLHAASPPDAQGVLRGGLLIRGRGDPSFSARFENGAYSKILARVVAAARQAGIRKIEGGLIGDDTFFSGPRYGSNWTWDDLQYYYGAEISALSVQDNVIDLTFKPASVAGQPCSFEVRPETDFVRFINQTRTADAKGRASIAVRRPLGENTARLTGALPLGREAWTDAVTVSNPALWFVHLLRGALEREGISVAGELRARSWPEPEDRSKSWRELAAIESPPVSELVANMMKPSQNLYAQLLLLQAGAKDGSAAGGEETSEERGLKALNQFVLRAGLPAGTVLLEEGSGLSRGCLVTPESIVGLLRFMARHRHAEAFRASLAEPGVEGTLRARLRELKGNLRAKTGSLNYVSTLSGYMASGAGEPLAFAILLNAYTGPGSGRDEVDAIPSLLAQLKERVQQ